MKGDLTVTRNLFARFYLSRTISYQLSKFPINKALCWMFPKDAFLLFRTRIISKCVSDEQGLFCNGLTHTMTRIWELIASLIAWHHFRASASSSLMNSFNLGGLSWKRGKFLTLDGWSRPSLTPFFLLTLYDLLRVLTGGLPWWSSGKRICLAMQRRLVQSLVAELRPHMPRSN